MHHFQAKRSITYSFWARVKILFEQGSLVWNHSFLRWWWSKFHIFMEIRILFQFVSYDVLKPRKTSCILIFTNLIPSPSPIRIEMLEMRLMINDFKIRYFHQINRNDWKQFQFISLYHFSSSNHFWLAFWNSDQDA